MIAPTLPDECANPDIKLTAAARRELVARLRSAIVEHPRLRPDGTAVGLRIGIYARISRDKVGFARGVERQIEDDRELAEAKNGVVVAVYVDNDVSAYSGKPRPDYERMMTDVKAGLLDLIIAWHPDRLHRSPSELERFIAIVEREGVEVSTVKAGHYDLSTPSGRMVARQLGAVARYESEHKAERISRERQQRARAGQWVGGPRIYGYENDGVTIRPKEQQVIQGVVESLSAGISLRAIVSDLNAGGIATPREGKRWVSSTLTRVLMNPRIAGFATYKGEIVNKGVWPALISEDHWHAVHAILSSPGRKTNYWGRAVRWLGSGLYLCGGCNVDTMKVGKTSAKRHVYRCGSMRDVRRNGTVHVARDMLRLDEYVELSVVERLSQRDLIEVFAPEAKAIDVKGLRLELSGARSRLDELSSLFADNRITAAQLTTGSERLRARVDQIEREMANVAQVGPIAEFMTVESVERHWFGTLPDRSDGLSLTKRRAVIDELLSVTVLPGRRAHLFDPKLVDLSWKTAA
ncbi:recombinase family protein [Nocardia brasiliensis]|uniref:recombinase family protein n=1 Tax=Nocardia brasiliensis TaxID=37326 RepID=UPI002454906A|nr:recombinase family protein [Nocardia brasiliensis]